MPNHSQRVSPHSGGTHNPHINTMETANYIRVEIGHPCGAGASHLSTIWEGRDDECPWDELEEVAKEEGKVLVSSCLSWVATDKGMELIPD